MLRSVEATARSQSRDGEWPGPGASPSEVAQVSQEVGDSNWKPVKQNSSSYTGTLVVKVLSRCWFISRFLAFKTPLDERFNDQIPPEHRFTPDMLFQSMKAHKVKIGLVIDLTNTERFYDKKLMEENECKYVKLSCRGHGETPSPDAVKTFVHICKTYIANNPLDIVGVHCTHGFNRWILISIYLILN